MGIRVSMGFSRTRRYIHEIELNNAMLSPFGITVVSPEVPL